MEKVERVLKLIVPPSESAPLSGVWPLMSSIASNIAPVIDWSSKLRVVPITDSGELMLGGADFV